MQKIIILVLLITGLSAFRAGSAFENSDLLNWDDRTLDWSDFTGNARYDSWEAAVTSYKIGYRLSYRGYGIPRVDVFCQFVKSQSWVRKDAMTKEILNHEQKHFDLAEVFARKLRRNISNSDLRDYSFYQVEKRIEEMYKDVWETCSSTQDRYDAETRHGLDEEKQAVWNESIQEMLDNSAQFKR